MTTVMLSGPMTLYEASEIREELMAALNTRQPLRLDLETTGPWDLAGLQLLASAVASAREAGVPIRFLHVPTVCAEVAERCGLRDWLEEYTDSFL
jgi:anti-anti-sigma regulatory factor